MIDQQKQMEATREKLRQAARDSWSGATGEERAAKLDDFLDQLLPSYSRVLNLPEAEILAAMESARNYSAINYYQSANFPSLDGVVLIDSVDEFKTRYPSGRYRCPACDGVSTDPYVCNSGAMVQGKPCDWKSYGLFGTMGKGLRVALRNGFLQRPKVDEIFAPIE